jgi:lysophospholipase L1-like esterase
MALGIVAIGVLAWFTLNRPPPPEFTPPASTEEPAEPQAAEPARILVVGEDLSVGSPLGGAGMAAWPQLVAADIGSSGRAVGVQVAAADGAGYQRPGPNGETFSLLVTGAGTDFDLVVLFGSRNDNGTAAAVQAGVTEAIAAVRSASPDAGLLVIGPASQIAPPPGFLLTNRDAVGAAATAAGATFVDPLADGWFTGRFSGLIGADDVHPTDEGHRYLADLIRPLIDSVLPAPS